MSARHLALLAACLCLMPSAQASLTEKQVDLPTCTLHLRVIQNSVEPAGPRFIMMDGVPLSGAVFRPLAERFAAQLGASSTLIDFPGVGRSSLKGGHYGWEPLRECLRAYLASQPPHTFVLADLAMPVIAPLLKDLPQIRRLVVMNSVLVPSQLRPPFPLNFLRCCPELAVAVGGLVPDVIFENRIETIGLGRPDETSREAVRALTAEMLTNHGLQRLAKLLSDIELDQTADRQIRDGLSRQIPQLFLWGEADPALGDEHKSLQPLAAHQRLLVLPQARHFFMLDFVDEAAEAITTWNATFP